MTAAAAAAALAVVWVWVDVCEDSVGCCFTESAKSFLLGDANKVSESSENVGNVAQNDDGVGPAVGDGDTSGILDRAAWVLERFW